MKKDTLHKWERIVLVSLFVLLGAHLFSIVQAANIVGENYANVTVTTTVNITNAQPEFMRVVTDELYNSYGVAGVDNITLNAGGNRTVLCNVTLRDWNGVDEENITLNASFFDTTVSSVWGANANTSHYTESNCTLLAGSPYGQNNAYGNYSCELEVAHYANNDTWNCTVFAIDTRGGQNYVVNESNTTEILQLYALNVTDGINYGDVAVGETSENISVNITNFGNVQVNVTIQGYAITVGDGLALACNPLISAYNISIENEVMSTDSTTTFDQKLALDGTIQGVENLTLFEPTDAEPVMYNETLWQLQIPVSINPSGVCNGTVIFSALIP